MRCSCSFPTTFTIADNLCLMAVRRRGIFNCWNAMHRAALCVYYGTPYTHDYLPGSLTYLTFSASSSSEGIIDCNSEKTLCYMDGPKGSQITCWLTCRPELFHSHELRIVTHAKLFNHFQALKKRHLGPDLTESGTKSTASPLIHHWCTVVGENRWYLNFMLDTISCLLSR